MGAAFQFCTATGVLRLEGGDDNVNLLYVTERCPENWPRWYTLCWVCFTKVYKRIISSENIVKVGMFNILKYGHLRNWAGYSVWAPTQCRPAQKQRHVQGLLRHGLLGRPSWGAPSRGKGPTHTPALS